MDDKLTIIVSYHDKNLLKINKIKNHTNSFTQNVIFINNNKYTTDTLNEIKTRFPFRGVQFDEFNAQSYYCEKLTKHHTDYVYHMHYRRILKDVYIPEIELDKKNIYCVYDGSDYKMINHINNFVVNDIKSIDIICKILSNIFNIPTSDVKDILYEESFISKEMYIMHISLLKEMIQKGYKFIKLFCTNISTSHFNKRRIVGYSLELFVSFFFVYKKLYEKYNLIYKDIEYI